MKWLVSLAACIGFLPFITGCGTEVTHHSQPPAQLSDWGLFSASGGNLVLSEGVEPYDLNTPLFTDYAHKWRTIWLPPGSQITLEVNGDWQWPVGAILSKTFYYPVSGENSEGSGGKGNDSSQVLKVDDHGPDFDQGRLDLNQVRLMETRLLVHQTDGWQAYPYIWRADQSDADFEVAGDIQMLTLNDQGVKTEFAYVVPDANQCAGCHAPNFTTKELRPIGLQTRHVNKNYQYHPDGEVANQLARWAEKGYLSSLEEPMEMLPANALWQAQPLPELDHQVRSYLDINCGHCHNPSGAADTSGLWLHKAEQDPVRLGVCKPPVAAGQGTGNNLFSIVPGKPHKSILTYRMASLDPGAMMPELGRSLVHEEGVNLVNQWIAQMDGQCQ